MLLFGYILVYFRIHKPLNNSYSSFGSIPILNASKVSPGYTLIAPYNRFNQEGKNPGKIYLLDLWGNVVHEWHPTHQALYSKLKPSGNLIVLLEEPSQVQGIPGGGNLWRIQELDWDSNILWEYKNNLLHHDVALLENGNIVAPVWQKVPVEISQNIQGGVAGTEINGEIYSDVLTEIDKDGKTVWEWKSYEHLDPQIDIIGPLMVRNSWSFINGIEYLKENPIDGKEGYLLSMRQINTVMIVRKSDGEIIWRSPKDMLNTQHDPTLLESGNILVYDNGLYRIPAPQPIYASRVVEINPKTDQIAWQFDGGESAIDKTKMFSAIVGGAQRLPNGNTLITDGVRGHIFEVTSDKEVVWDLINPYETEMTGKFPNNFVFKTRRYGPDEINWPKKINPPLNNLQYSLYQGLSKIYPK